MERDKKRRREEQRLEKERERGRKANEKFVNETRMNSASRMLVNAWRGEGLTETEGFLNYSRRVSRGPGSVRRRRGTDTTDEARFRLLAAISWLSPPSDADAIRR